MYSSHSRDRSQLETSLKTNLNQWKELEKRDIMKVVLCETFNNLSLELQDFLILCKGTNLTQAEIGLVFGCSQLQVHQGIKRASRKLLKNFAKSIDAIENFAFNSDNLVLVKEIMEEELSSQIKQLFGDRIDSIYQSLEIEKKKSLTDSFFRDKT
ncbi:hypothetical protein [Spirulina sp. 06S082]|uniref:hypothetical protein n=1 Tax=Spirulina sp. 06S082 TaxID=3110248 RepID=UPI002B203638|nr:hypothetical protein [Spirulina sp. 06S082]MEA5468422.1 hypothetical protein [Spirulina sp. 06S082]